MSEGKIADPLDIESLYKKIEALTDELKGFNSEHRISFSDFCREYKISRWTGYRWASQGLIHLEKIGGRQFVPLSSISVVKKL